MQFARLGFRDSRNHHGDGRGHGDDDPHQRRKGEAAEGPDLKQQRAGRIEVADGAKGQQKHHRRSAGYEDEREVNGAMQSLLLAAAQTFGEVLLVVGSHVWREAGDVIAPTGKNLTDDLVHTDVPHTFSTIYKDTKIIA